MKTYTERARLNWMKTIALILTLQMFQHAAAAIVVGISAKEITKMKGQITRHEWEAVSGNHIYQCKHCPARKYRYAPGFKTEYRLTGGTWCAEEPPCITRKKPEDGKS